MVCNIHLNSREVQRTNYTCRSTSRRGRGKKVHSNIWVTDGDNIGIAKTREQISYEWGIKRQSRFWVIDDDSDFYMNTQVRF